MKRIILESAPEFILLCVVVALAYAGIQYYRTKNQPWNKTTNGVLFGLRFVLTFLLCFLLLGPIVRQVINNFEKPRLIFVVDNSTSVAQMTDSIQRVELENQLRKQIEELNDAGFEASLQDLSGKTPSTLQFNATQSDLQGALRAISSRYEGQQVGGVVLVSDGIYNSGIAPTYGNFPFPIQTIGIGDTTVRLDVAIRNVAFNKIAYQGNKFPVRAEVQVKNLEQNSIALTLSRGGKIIERLVKPVGANGLITFDFQPLAEQQGIQKFDLQAEVISTEQNTRNNRASIFVEVVEGKKKILIVAPAPHPDIKALRDVIERNANYECTVFLPGLDDGKLEADALTKTDLVIFHQAPDIKGRTLALYQQFLASKANLFLILGAQTDLRQLSGSKAGLRYETMPREFDEVTPVVNNGFTNFSLSPESVSTIGSFPPVSVPFGKPVLSPSASLLLTQKIGSIPTEKPLLAVDVRDGKKIAFLFGSGVWRWKLNEYDRTEGSKAFEEIFGKLIQFLSTTDDKRKFRFYPLQQEFSSSEPVAFESQVYNDIFEPVYGNEIQIELTSDTGSKSSYRYTTSAGNTRYQIGGLKEGVYKYNASTVVKGKVEQVRGEFAVLEQQSELLNLTADFDLLRKLSSTTGGKFFDTSQIGALGEELRRKEAKQIIRTEEQFDSVINLKWVFFLLLALVSAEWFVRKYNGSY